MPRRRRGTVRHGLPDDPLGRDTVDFDAFLGRMVEHALSGRDREAIVGEMNAAERRLGLEPRRYRT